MLQAAPVVFSGYYFLLPILPQGPPYFLLGEFMPSLKLPSPPEDIGRLKVREAVEVFIKYLRVAGASERTLRAYRAALKSFANVVGDKMVKEMGPEDFAEWISFLRSNGVERPRSNDPASRQSTLHYYSIFVRRFLSWIGVRSNLPTVPRRRRGFSDALSWSDVERLLNASRDLLDALIVAMLAETGLRANELLSLRPEDIDLERGEVKVRGKYGKERIVFLGPLSRFLVEEWLRLKGKEERLVPISYQALYKRLKSLARRAGVDERRVRPHVLRHTFATEALRRGMSLVALQRILGHSNIRVTELYIHLQKEDLRREYESTFVAYPQQYQLVPMTYQQPVPQQTLAQHYPVMLPQAPVQQYQLPARRTIRGR